MVSVESVMGPDFSAVTSESLFPSVDAAQPLTSWQDFKASTYNVGNWSGGGTVGVYHLETGSDFTAVLGNSGASLGEPGSPGPGGTFHIALSTGYHILNEVAHLPPGPDGKSGIRCIVFLDAKQTDLGLLFEYNRSVRIPPIEVPGAVSLSCLEVGAGRLIPLQEGELHSFRRRADGAINVVTSVFQ